MKQDEWTHIVTVPGLAIADQVKEVLSDSGLPVLVKQDLLTGAYLVRGTDRGHVRILVRPEDQDRACEMLRGMLPDDAFQIPGDEEGTDAYRED